MLTSYVQNPLILRGAKNHAQKRQEMPAAALTEPGVEDGQLPAHRVPALARAGRPPRLPDGQQVAHLKDGEDDELEEGGRGKRVEQRLDHDPGGEVQQAQVRVHDGLLPDHQQRHFRGALQAVQC